MPFLLFILVATYMARFGLNAISHNFNIAAEANNLYGILEVFDGHLLYPPKTQIPFGIYLYPPLQPFLYAFLLKIFPLKSLYAQVIFLRSLSLICYAGAVRFLYLISKRNFSYRPYFFFLALALSFFKFADYISSTRNDMLSLFWEVGAFYYFLEWNKTPQRKNLFLLFLLFSTFSIWTRQTGVAVLGGCFLFLLSQKKWKESLTAAGFIVLANIIFFGTLHWTTQGNIWMHLILSNLRGFRPLDHSFFDYPLYTFLLSYVLFTFLAWKGFKKTKDQKLYHLVAATSFVISAMVYLRAGGDVNYFFETIFLFVPIVALTLESFYKKVSFKVAFSVQCLVIAVFCSLKTYSAYQSAFLPFETAANKIKKEIRPYGFVSGLYSQNMGIYLRGWAIHGPDVSNAGFVAKNAHKTLWYFIKNLSSQFDEREIPAIVSADPNCESHHRGILFSWQSNYQKLEKWYPWLCLYYPEEPSKNKHPVLGMRTSGNE